MNNIYNYINNYGNYSFKEKEFTDIDNLIFSSLVYLDYSNTPINENKYTLKEIGNYYLKNNKKLNKDELLLKEIINKKRYQDIILSNYIYKRNKEMQFGAITFHITNKLIYISFEGTDKHISSFKEDAYLACIYPVSSQIEAINYVNKSIKVFGPKVIIGGHSKGGNLALIAGMFMKNYKQNKVLKIYSNDGPGLRKKEFESNEYQKIKNKYIHIVPSESIVGVLLRNDKYQVIKTNKKGIKAHSMINWIVEDDHLVFSKLSKSSIKLSNNFIKWLDKHDDTKRLYIVNNVFKIFENQNIDDINSITIKQIIELIKEIRNIDEETVVLIKDLLLNIIDNKGE